MDEYALQQRNRFLEARIKDLEEQARIKQEKWDEVVAANVRVESLTRALCEMILAKDKNESKLGAGYTWRSFSTEALLEKATNSYKDVSLQQMLRSRRLMDEYEKRGKIIDGLQAQFERMQKEGLARTEKSYEEIRQEAEEEQKKQEALAKMPNATKKQMDEGKINVQVVISEDADEGSYMDMLAEQEELMRREKEIITGATPVRKAKRKKEDMDELEQKVSGAFISDIENIVATFIPIDETVIQTIGSTGLSVSRDIIAKIMEGSEKNKNTAIRASLKKLTMAQLLEEEQISLPITKNPTLYTLTALGERVYKAMYNNPPVQSQKSIVIAEHDNVEHGYGIYELADCLEAKGTFAEVNRHTRSCGIRLNDGSFYIPDIICTTQKGGKVYYEYERNTHTQEDFNNKCEKMLKCTRYMQFVAPNKDAVAGIKDKVDRWIATKDKSALRGGVRIKITSSRKIADSRDNILGDSMWDVVYDFSKPQTVVQNNL